VADQVGLNKEKPSAKSAIFLHFLSLLNVNLQEYPDAHFVWSGWSAVADQVGLNKEKPSAKSAIFLHFLSLLNVNLQEYPDAHFVWSGWTSGGA